MSGTPIVVVDPYPQTYPSQHPTGGLLRDGGSVETFATLFPTSATLGGTNTFDPVLPSEISYPDGFVYLFRYNVYGELTPVNVSQGGSVEYEYGDGHNNRFSQAR